MEIDDGNEVINEITVPCVHSCSMNTRIPSVFCKGLAYQLCLMNFMRCSWSVSSIGPFWCPFRASIHFEVCHDEGIASPVSRQRISGSCRGPAVFGSLLTVYCLGRSLLSCVNVEVRGLSNAFNVAWFTCQLRWQQSSTSWCDNHVWLFTCSNKVTPIAHLFLHIHRYTFVVMLWAGMPIQILV